MILVRISRGAAILLTSASASQNLIGWLDSFRKSRPIRSAGYYMQPENPYSPSSTETAAKKSRIRTNRAFIATVAVVTVGSLMLCSKATPFSAGLFFVPFAFGPLIVTLGLSLVLRSPHAQQLLTISSVAYAVWFAYVYLQAFYINLDPQSSLAFLFVGFYALPLIAAFWVAAGVMHWRTRK